MTISATLVKELRERTGAAMMDCKNALVQTKGDLEAAIEYMRKSGQAKAVKKAGRTTAEGAIIVKLSSDNKSAVMVEVNCETDFVGRDTNFLDFAEMVAEQALTTRIDDVEKLMHHRLEHGSYQTIEEARQALITKCGENIQVRRAVLMTASGIVGFYVHSNRIGALVQLSTADAALAKDIAMHIAASRPVAISPEQVSADAIEKEKEIFVAQAASSGKPADIIEKMVAGRIKKYMAEVSLMGQSFVREPEKTVGDLLKNAHAEVQGFVCFEVGEGIEKKTVNFAEEVMSQVRGG